MRPSLAAALVLTIGGIAAAAARRPSTAALQAPDGATTGGPAEVSIQQFNDRMVEKLRRRIAGREPEPASAVFTNIRIEWLADVPAGRLLDIMNGGYSRALGVRCTHCHVDDDFASDELRPKRAAREMAAMHKAINDQLGGMTHLEGAPQDRFINCATCHRGRLDPRDARTGAP